jgi:pimeloyl-ACP methyl ester carboxylesterase
MQYRRLNNFMMALDDVGRGIPLLFIHGYPLSRALWKPQLEGLSDIARVIAPDLRGHGNSTSAISSGGDYSPYSMEMLADDCAQLLDALEIDQPIILCGLSMGGYVSFAFYRKYPHRVAGLILAATRAIADSPAVKENRRKAIDRIKLAGTDPILESMLPIVISPSSKAGNPEMIEYVREMMQSVSVEGMIGDLLGMIERSDSTPLLTEINVPTIILVGNEDQIIPISEAEGMHASIAGSKLAILPRAGHLLNLEQPDLFNDVVRDYLLTSIRGSI